MVGWPDRCLVKPQSSFGLSLQSHYRHTDERHRIIAFFAINYDLTPLASTCMRLSPTACMDHGSVGRGRQRPAMALHESRSFGVRGQAILPGKQCFQGGAAGHIARPMSKCSATFFGNFMLIEHGPPLRGNFCATDLRPLPHSASFP